MKKKTEGFSLIELLVVIGIIGILLAILLPVASSARQSARSVKCLAQLHELTTGMLMYAEANHHWFPASASGHKKMPNDWVAWRTPDLSDSALMRFVPLTAALLTCPEDDPSTRTTNWYFTNQPPYPYSYSVNATITGRLVGGSNSTPPVKLTTIRATSDRILMVCESPLTLNDGMWLGDEHQPCADLVSLLHGRRVTEKPPILPGNGDSTGGPTITYLKNSGNVSFVDGHVAKVTRYFAHYIGFGSQPRGDGNEDHNGGNGN